MSVLNQLYRFIFPTDYVVPNRQSVVKNIPVISYGTVVDIQSTRCNGMKECWDGGDELECGYNTSFTIKAGITDYSTF